VTRLLAVLGYSDGTTDGLHAVCDARLRRATEEAAPEDVLLFSGWARSGSASAEADLMAASWKVPAQRRLVDRYARTTLGNALGVARAAREVDAKDVVLVTSSWHARRAKILVRAALSGSGARVRVASTAEPISARRGLREAGAWLLVPLLVVVAARNR
jgi:uncharacterized SAM-binding protein YcdF (DUF218 family)